MFRVYDKLSMCKNGVEYRYTIDLGEDEILGILKMTNIFNISIRQALVFLENKGAYINSFDGVVFFKTKEEAENFIQFMDDYNKSLM